MFRDIIIEDMLALKEKGEITLIDVRSPSEYNISTIPGSLNIPLFDDKERAEIGTLYKQVSPEAAQDRGLEIVSAKLPNFIKAFKQINGDITVLLARRHEKQNVRNCSRFDEFEGESFAGGSPGISEVGCR